MGNGALLRFGMPLQADWTQGNSVGDSLPLGQYWQETVKLSELALAESDPTFRQIIR
jgi:hypothetical protein